MKTEIDDLKVKHGDILQQHLDEIKQVQSLIQQTMQSLKEVEESNEVSMIIEYSSKIRDFNKLPPKVEISLPSFTPNPIDRERLYCFLGQITPLSTATEENVLSQKQSNTSVKKLLDKPEIVTTIHTKFNELFNVTFVNQENIWTSGETDDIRCFNTTGLLLHTLKTKSGNWPNDITADIEGDILYCDWSTKTIYEVKNEQTEELIRLQGWMPCQLCVTFTGDLLVTMYSDDYTQSKVVRYSGSTEKQTIQFDDEGKPLYSGNVYMKYITENRNHDICVADCGGGAVVVVNQDGELRWRHTGHPSTTKYESFIPWGITTDSQSRVLAADGDNHCIIVLDQNGQFLCYIDNCDLNFPWGLCVDNDDNLFVCESVRGNVTKIKYLK
uniref:Uncharacterized protein n=1 Tax=Magallana gigas TaxID=29159 RepID=K1Q8T4_MAGGI